MWTQTHISFALYPRGHLITDEVERQLPDLKKVSVGIASYSFKHLCKFNHQRKSGSVRSIWSSTLIIFVPERAPYYVHTYEGDDDMPKHILKHRYWGQVSQSQFQMGDWH